MSTTGGRVGEKPMGISIMLCEKVITEAGTNNKTLVSTFNSLQSKSFPCLHPRLTVYVALTNTTGEKDITLVFAQGEAKLVQMGGKVQFSNPNHVVELLFNVINLPIAEPGVYSFEVLADGEYIFESRFLVVKIE